MAWNTKRQLLFVLNGWRGGCFSCEILSCCLLLCLLSRCQTLFCSHPGPAHRICSPGRLCGGIIVLCWQAASPGLQSIPSGPHFIKCMGEKREWWLFSSASGSWSSLSVASGMVKSAPSMILPEWGSGGWAEPMWGLAVVTLPNVLSFNTAKSQEQRPSGKTNTIMQNKPGSQSKHWQPLLSWQRKSLLKVFTQTESWRIGFAIQFLGFLGFCVAIFI